MYSEVIYITWREDHVHGTLVIYIAWQNDHLQCFYRPTSIYCSFRDNVPLT